MISSKYLTAFARTGLDAKDSVTLVGDCILVEHLPEEEVKTKSGLVIATNNDLNNNWKASVSADKPVLVRVLAVGEGYYDDEGLTVPLNVKQGDIALVGRQSTKWFSQFGALADYDINSIGLTRESEIQMIFHGQEGYDSFFKTLNAAMQVVDGSAR